MKMNLNLEFIVVGVVFILILFVSTYGSAKEYIPYTASPSKLSLYPYEGFVGDNNLQPVSIDPKKQADTSHRSLMLAGSSLSQSAVTVDKVSQLPGSPECIGNSASLSNSKGGICLDAATIQQIKTRGSNFS